MILITIMIRKLIQTIDFVVVRKQLKKRKNRGHPPKDLVKAYEAAGYKSNRPLEFFACFVRSNFSLEG